MFWWEIESAGFLMKRFVYQAQITQCIKQGWDTSWCLHLKMRSHQTRIKRYAQIIYMLSQCKDAIDNPAARMVRITRRELSVWRTIHANSASWTIWTLADIRATLTNQELALAVTWLRAEAENPKKQWRTNELRLYVGTRSCTILLCTFTKTGINFATRLELPGRSPSHDANVV